VVLPFLQVICFEFADDLGADLLADEVGFTLLAEATNFGALK
jgi:hypothetical protein